MNNYGVLRTNNGILIKEKIENNIVDYSYNIKERNLI